MSLLCKLGIHNYKVVGEPTKAYGLKNEYIYKTRIVCSRCGESKLKIAKRQRS